MAMTWTSGVSMLRAVSKSFSLHARTCARATSSAGDSWRSGIPGSPFELGTLDSATAGHGVLKKISVRPGAGEPSGRQASEVAEVAHQVRLVGVPVPGREQRPVRARLAHRLSGEGTEPGLARQRLRPEPHMPGEVPLELADAEVHLLRQPPH